MSRARPYWSRTGALTATPAGILLPNGWNQLKILVDARCYGRVSKDWSPPAVASVNGVTTLTESAGPTGGTFVLIVFPEVATLNQTLEDEQVPAYTKTAAIPWNETAANIKTALVNTTVFASGDITPGGGAMGSAPVTLTWTGEYAGVHPRLDVDASGLTGAGNMSILVRQTTVPVGNGGYGYLEQNVQEIWDADDVGNENDRFLHLASVGASANYFLTALK